MSIGKEQNVDYIIVGSGIAALRAAVDLAPHGRVLLLNKGELLKPAGHYHLGGVAVALAEDDEVHLHRSDTLQAGDGLCREPAVSALVEEGPDLIQQLITWGMRFRSNGTKLAFTSVGAHSRSRVLHAHGDSTGGEMHRVLIDKVKTLDSIHLQAHAFAVELILNGESVTGVRYLDEKNASFKNVQARAVLLATGGLGQVYQETTNPATACGDGVAMAYRAGAVMSDMEFIQFHPTALYTKGAPRFVLSEALCGEGAELRNLDLERFMPRYHEGAELAPRDVLSRALLMEMQKCQSEFNYLDLTSLDPERIKKRFPNIYSRCMEFNIDITADLIPVRPAAHYSMGGIATDLNGATSLKGLYAAGEVAATGVHGANRLASNSLLEDLVYGARAAAAMVKGHGNSQSYAQAKTAGSTRRAGTHPATRRAASPGKVSEGELEKLTQEVRSTLWKQVGIIREGKALAQATEKLEHILSVNSCASSRRHYEQKNIVEVARLIATCALAREESRGAHYRSDFPLKNTAVLPQHSYMSNESSVHFEE